MINDIPSIMATCVFLACKVEESHIKIENFLMEFEKLTNLKFSKETILNYEETLLKGLNFHLQILHSDSLISGFLNEFMIDKLLNEVNNELIESCLEFIQKLIQFDIIFYFPPGKFIQFIFNKVN
jgi:hypothetical protein